MKDNRTISFKKLNDHRRREALIPFLSAADSIEGICVTIAIHKDIKDLCTNGGVLDELTKSLPLQGKWNKKSFEKMIRVAYFVSLFVAGLSKRGQDIYWISDEDEIFSNQHRASDVARIVSGFTSIYVKHKLGNLGVGTVKLDEGDHLEEDFASIPDLAAGAVCEIILALDKATKGRFTYEGIAHPIPYNISSKANIISSWLDDNTLPLKRLNMIFDIRDKGYSIGSYRLSL